MHHPTDRIAHTTAFVTPVVEHWLEREINLTVPCRSDEQFLVVLAALPPRRHVKRRLAQLDVLVQFGVEENLLADLVQQVDPSQAAAGALLRYRLHVQVVGGLG